MYKLYTDINQANFDLSYLDNKVIEFKYGSAYDNLSTHPVNSNSFAINITRTDILQKIMETDKSVINEIWLATNVVNELDSSWSWFDSTRPYRLIIDTSNMMGHIASNDELSQAILGILSAFVGQIFVQGTTTQIYLANLNPFNGIDPNILITTYPTTFLRIDTKTN